MNERRCSVADCENQARSGASRYCEKHYYRLRRHGDTSVRLPASRPESFDEVFTRLVPVGRADECWEWKGSINSNGYGTVGARREYAHRYVYRHMVGEIPSGYVVRHYICDNPPCVNPRHLRVGTHRENREDAASKMRHAFGGRMPQAKLSDSDVICARLQRRQDSTPYVELAAQFGVSPQQISKAVRGLGWAHVPSDARPECACHDTKEETQ